MVKRLDGRAQRAYICESAYVRLVGSHWHYQCCILQPVLLNISIHDPHAGVELVLHKSADNTQLGNDADSLEGGETWQRQRAGWEHWAISTGIQFSKGQCRVLCWDGAVPRLGTDGTSGWGAVQQEETWGCWWQQAQCEPVVSPGSQGGKPVLGCMRHSPVSPPKDEHPEMGNKAGERAESHVL